MQLLFASGNTNKISEIRQMLPAGFELFSLADIGFTEDIPETAPTIEGNAILKAEYLEDKQHMACFADDTGLVIPALNDEPGVLSARYAGEEKNAQKNMDLVLERLKGKADRRAHFVTVIALRVKDKTYVFEGRVDGTILSEKRGDNGFGYDPVFQPDGYSKTFAEMTSEEKNALSHRGLALQKMMGYLETHKWQLNMYN